VLRRLRISNKAGCVTRWLCLP